MSEMGIITISDDLVTPVLLALVLVAFYWLRRAYRGRQRYSEADREAVREKARRRL